MIDLPLQCRLSKAVDVKIAVNLNEFRVNGVRNFKGVSPNLLSETIDREYMNLTLDELAFLETTFDSTNGVTRLVYDGKRWIINGYISYYNPPYKLGLTLTRVG